VVGRQYGKGVDNHGGKPKVARLCLLIEEVRSSTDAPSQRLHTSHASWR
jgi:hypothetical protein